MMGLPRAWSADAKAAGVTPEVDAVCLPAPWREPRTMVAYSKEGYQDRSYPLPSDWGDVGRATLERITVEGLQAEGEVDVRDGVLTLSVAPGTALAISPLGGV